MINKFYCGEDACFNLAEGVSRLTQLMKYTYGPLGSCIILGNPLSVPVSVRSGNGIIQEIDLNNPGTELAKEAVIKMAETEGDGTTVASILLGKMVEGAVRMAVSGLNPVRLRKAMTAEAGRICDWLEAGAHKSIDMRAAARLSAAGDEELEALICQAFEKVTAEGIVTVRDGKGMDSYVESFDSMEIDQGYLSEEMITDSSEAAAVLEYPYIMLTDQVISKSEMIVPAMNLARKAGKSLFIMAQDITGEALATLLVNIRNGKLRTVAVKATAFGERRKEILQDLAAATGAVVMEEGLGESLEQITAFHFGTAAIIRATGSHTFLSGGGGDPQILRNRISRIRAEMAAAVYEVDRVNMRNRLARLEGGVAVIHVGAPTETEMRSRRQKIKSTVAAVKAMVRSGVVAGGGIALFNAACELYGLNTRNGSAEASKQGEEEAAEEIAAARLMAEALKAPLEQLLLNSESSPYEIIDHLKTMPAGYGYDVVKKRYGSMMEMGIMDAAGTLGKAVELSASLAGMIVTAGAVCRTIR